MASFVETESPVSASPEHAVRLLGPLEVRGRGGVVEVGGVRRQAVLALLVLHEGRPVSLERLIARLWPFRPPANAAASVRNNISALRKLLGTVDGVCIETVGSSYVLQLPSGALDARTARARIRRGLRLLDGDQARAAGVELRAALSLWRGGLLPNLRQAGYEWAELTELDELWLLASESLAEADLRCGRHRDLVPRLKCLVRQHPERQVLHRQRVTALAGAGRPGEAVAAYHEARAALRAAGQTVGVQLSAVHRALLDRTDATTPRIRVMSPADPGTRLHPVGAARACDRGLGPDGAHPGRADGDVAARDVADGEGRPVVVACARITAGRTRLGRDYGELAAGYGATVSERPDGLLLAVFTARPGDGGSALEPALEMALAWRRRSRDTGHGAPAIAVVSAENDATVTPHPGTDPVGSLVERVIGLAGRTSPGAVSVE